MSRDARTCPISEAAAVPPAGENNLICMARPQLRGVDEELFTPLFVPIGPYHHAKCSYRWMEEKKRAANEIMDKYEARDELKKELLKLEGDARARYGSLGEMVIGQEQFLDMLLHDGCYVLRYFVDYGDLRGGHLLIGEENTVMRDIMYLLENQIPMVILEPIHRYFTVSPILSDVAFRVRLLLMQNDYISGAERSRPATTSHLLQLVHTYFEPTIPATEEAPTSSVQQETQGYEAARLESTSTMCCTWPTFCITIHEGGGQQGTQENAAAGQERAVRMGPWRRATEYCRYANVQLKLRPFAKDQVQSILDVHLEGSTLCIPLLRIERSTWTMLRNLMALEEQGGTGGSPVTAYCVFMSQLACKVEDIELLKRKKILQHFWGNDEVVAQDFANLCKGVALDLDNANSNYLYPMWCELEERCDSLGHNCWGSFRDKHCGDSMRILAFFTAGILFAFQLLQVILTGFSLRHQGK